MLGVRIHTDHLITEITCHLHLFPSYRIAGQLRRAIEGCLTPQEKQVIILRYGLDGQSPKRQREVAQVTGISRSYVSRIEKRALGKLRAALER